MIKDGVAILIAPGPIRPFDFFVMGLATHAKRFHYPPRCLILDPADRIDPMQIQGAKTKTEQATPRFGGIALAPESASDRPANLGFAQTAIADCERSPTNDLADPTRAPDFD